MANIYQEDLDGFLALAEELQLKGLAGSNEDQPIEENKDRIEKVKTRNQPLQKQETWSKHYERNEDSEKFIIHREARYKDQSIVPVESDMIDVTNNEDLKVKIASMMESIAEGDFRYKCTVCGKAAKDRTNMGRHVESHIERVSHPCNLCRKVSRSGSAHKMHISRYHRK